MVGIQLPANDLSFSVSSSRFEYPVKFGLIQDLLRNELDAEDGVVLIDSSLQGLAETLGLALGPNWNTVSVVADEESKQLPAIAKFAENLVLAGLKKNSRLLVVGGGVIQDIGGFISTILFRGIEWIYVPTTLAAQGDSCIGSKSSINLSGFKNSFGSFWPPSQVLIDTTLLASLPRRQIISGLGELAHYFFLGTAADLSYFKEKVSEILNGEAIDASLISKSLEIKRPFVEADEFDTGIRRMLNLGHTFAHGIESASGNKIAHGEAVALGLQICVELSRRIGMLPGSDAETLLRSVDSLVREIPRARFTPEDLVAAMLRDKKNSNHKITFILLKGIGVPEMVSLEPEDKFLRDSIHFFQDRWEALS